MSPVRSGEVVVKFRVREKLSDRILVGIQLRRRAGQIFAHLAVLREQRIVRREFAERALARSNILNESVAVVDQLLCAVVDFRIIDELAERALLVLDGFENIIEAAGKRSSRGRTFPRSSLIARAFPFPPGCRPPWCPCSRAIYPDVYRHPRRPGTCPASRAHSGCR